MSESNKSQAIARQFADAPLGLDIKTGEIDYSDYSSISWGDLAALGTAFSSIPEQFRTVTQEFKVAMDGLYQGDTLGKVGQLAQARDDTGALGTIMNNGKFVGQMRWHKVDGLPVEVATKVPYDPTTLFVAAALTEINQKLDAILETQEEMFAYIKARDRAEVQGSLIFLADALKEFKCNWDNEKYRNSTLTTVQKIQVTANAQINLQRDQIGKLVGKRRLVHFGKDVDSRVEELVTMLQDYRLALYLYGFSMFIGVLLTENFTSDYLQDKIASIQERMIQYRELYTQAYDLIARYSESTVGQHVLSGLSAASKGIGKVVEKTPVGDRTQIDETLISAGSSLKKFGQGMQQDTMSKVAAAKDPGVIVFIDQINELDELYNKPTIYLFDDIGIHYRVLPSQAA